MATIPRELIDCPQWLLWRKVWIEEKQRWSKVPLSARTGVVASIVDSNNWSDYTTAEHMLRTFGETHAFNGLGFALGFESGVAGVDLDGVFDDTGAVLNYGALEIAERFESYTEYSPSRTGLHVLFKADIPDGRRTSFVEVYGQGRFFTVTGQPYLDKPIAERQWAADQLIADIAKMRAQSAPTPLDWTVTPKYSDDELWQMASSANNGEKFLRLFYGNWQEDYGSQSEADFALIDIIAFYTDSPDQVRRAFLASALGQREKAVSRPEYIVGMIARSFDRKAPLVTVPALPAASSAAPAVPDDDEAHEAEERAERASDPYTMPVGLTGEIAAFIYDQAPYPMKEAAIAAALTFMAGVCGRQFQFNGKGLNLYLMLLANTGSGKEAMSTGLGKVMDAIIKPGNPTLEPSLAALGFPAAAAFRGPADLTGRGVTRMFSKSKAAETLSCFCVMNEFATVMAQMADPRGTNTGMMQFKRSLLDLYMKSSQGNPYAGSMNADKESDVITIPSPALSLLCESTPGRLYAALSEELIADGMLPRMILFENEGYGQYNPHHATATVSQPLQQRLADLCKQVMELRLNGDTFLQVKATEDGAARSEEFRAFCRGKLIYSEADAHKELWNRAHLNAERIAALLAVGVNPRNPVVTVDMIDWAANIVKRQIVLLVGKFKRGEIGSMTGSDEGQQYKDLLRIIRRYMERSPDNMPASYAKYADARRAGLVPYKYLLQSTGSIASFKDERRGATYALKCQIENLTRTGTLAPARLPDSTATYYRVSL